MTGHLLVVSAVKSIVRILALRDNGVFPNRHLHTPDKSIILTVCQNGYAESK